LKILRDNYDLLKNIADILVERETLTGDELDDLIQGKPLPPLKNDGNKGLPPNPVRAKKTTEISETNQGLGEGNLNKLKPWKTPS